MDKRPIDHGLKVDVSDRQIFSIALPITLAILVPQVNILVNSIFLGQLSPVALGNAGITAVFYLIFAVAGNGFNNSMQTIFSRFAGKDKPAAFGNILNQGLIITFLFSLCCILFTWLFAPFILSRFADPSQLPEEMEFLRVRIFGLPFLYFFQVLNAFIIASLNSRLLLLGSLAQALINIFFDYALIFGHFGMPAMGFLGAAWASVISEAGAAAVVLVVLVFSGLRRKYGLLGRLRFDKVLSAEIAGISAPLVLQYVISVAFWLLFFLMIESYGTIAKGISNTMRSVIGLTGIFCWSLCGSANVMVSNLIGQDRHEEVMPIVVRIAIWSGAICSFLLLLLNIFPAQFFQLFSDDKEFVSAGIPVLRVVSVGMILMSTANIWLNAITGTGKTRMNLIIELAGVITYILYSWYLMKWNKASLAMAWTNELLYWGIILVSSYLYMKSGKWKQGETIHTE